MKETKTEANQSNDATQGRRATTCSAFDLLRSEAERLGGVMTSRASDADDLITHMRWAYSVSAAWLESRKDSSCISRWEEVETIPDHLLDVNSICDQRDKLQDENLKMKEAIGNALDYRDSGGNTREMWEKLEQFRFSQNVKFTRRPKL